MPHKAWSFVAFLVAFAVGSGVKWIANDLGMTNRWASDAVLAAAFFGVVALSRRLFGVPWPHNPYPGSDVAASLRK